MSPPAPPVLKAGSKVGFAVVLLLVALFFSRLIELMPRFVDVLRPGIVLRLAGVLIFVITGGWLRVLSSRISLLLLAFTLWSALGLPFAVWRGGAVREWVTYWASSLLAHIAVVALVVTLEQCRKVMYAIAGSMAALVVLSTFRAGSSRSSLERYGFDTGTLTNGNLLAMVLLMGLPFCWFASRQWKGLWKVFPVGAAIVMGASIFRTGSRAGLLTLGVLAFMLFWRASFPGKIKFLLGSLATLALGLSLSTQSALDRFKTFFRSGQEAPQSVAELSAAESSAMRAELFRRSLVQTARHPFFGVGTGMFAVADSNYATSEQLRALWGVSHNGYTQLSSETGIPGALLYTAAILLCLKRLRFIAKQSRKMGLANLSDMAFAIFGAVSAFAIEFVFVAL